MTHAEQRGYSILVLLATIWVGLIFLSPVLLSSGYAIPGFIIRMFFAPICHQDPLRSIHLFNSVFPVCERCSGIYFAFYAVVLLYPFLSRKKKRNEIDLKILIVFLIPMFCDYAFDVFGLWKNFSFSRMISGGIAGAGLALFVIPAWNNAINELLYTRQIFAIIKRNVGHG